ncbi:LCP family protein [Rubrobacter indicoceani]|uniref:LCP family protein n=1 Tax=Rubrobacter indicoceani TaxID=2051957 RepID=UPI000E5A5706|nr:LCP family protein [Rubrobacter indicoceani]
MKVYRAGQLDRKERGSSGRPRRGGGIGLRRALFAAGLVFLVLLLVLAWPFGSQRVVLLGSDARAEEASRADTIVVAKGGGGMLAVPRDTLVEIPEVGEDKVNAAFATGGPELTVETVEGLTDRRINNYIVIDFGGVEEIVDAIGGVTLTVEEPIELSDDEGPISIPTGEQALDGREALAFVRYRGTPTADIGRIGRQQQFLQALAGEAASPTKLPRLPATALAVWRNIDTNMNPVQTGFFAGRVGLQGIGEVAIYPGVPQYIDGISYWVPDENAGPQAVEETIG